MATVAVSSGVLRWALDRATLDAEDLQTKFPKIQKWIEGQAQPTLRQLESFAKATHAPFGFLFLEEPPEEHLPVPHFRTLGGDSAATPSPALLETIQMMQQRQAWMREHLLERGDDRLSYVRSADTDEASARVAGRIRRVLGLAEDWAASMRTWTDALVGLRLAMEEAGMLVVTNGVVGNNTHRKLDPIEFRGFVLVDEYAPLVFVNGADGKAAQMFTLAHELAHVFFGSSAAFDLRDMLPAKDRIEQACNKVAAEFLICETKLRDVWRSAKDAVEPFQALAHRFKVSAIVAARRALDLGLISKQAFLEFYRAYQADERRAAKHRRRGGDFHATQNGRIGQRFASAVVGAAREGKLLYSEAYRLTGLHGKTFDAYAASLSVTGV